MPVFYYKGYNTQGKVVKGYVDAETSREAYNRLKKEGVYVTRIEEGVLPSGGFKRISSVVGRLQLFFARISLRDVAAFTREFATLLRAGLPVVEALTALLEQFENPHFKRIIADIRDRVMEGASLAEAMASHRRAFSDLYVSMVGAGEASGTLEGILFMLADYLEDVVRFRSKMITIAIYPSIVFTVMIGVLVILVGFVIPRVSKIFADLGHSLPFYTRAIVGVSNITVNYWPLFIVAAVGVYIGYYFYSRRPAGRRRIDALKLKLPIIGRFVRLAVTSRFARTLGTLLKGGVSIVKALEIARGVIGNEVIKEVIDETKESIARGTTLSEPLKNSGVFPPVVIHMISAGERSGELEEMLFRVSEIFDQEIETATNAFISILEPLVVVLMAGLVLFIILSVLLPLLQMQQFIK